MENAFQISSLALQILSSFVTIVTALIAYINDNDKSGNVFYEDTKYPLGHKVVSKWLKWLIVVPSVIYYITTITLLCITDVSSRVLVSTLITFVVMLAGFWILAVLGRNSLGTRKVLAPCGLWQVLFNRIPSYLEECDGPFRIVIVKIGMLGEGDLDDEVGSGEQINKLVKEKIDLIKRSKEGQSFIDDDTPLYDIVIDNTPFYNRNDSHKIHGIIVFIGNRLPEEIVCSKIHVLADKYPEASLGYLSYGLYPSKGYLPPYINLKRLREKDYVDHLVFRYYARSQAWRKLSNLFHRWFVVALIFLTLTLAAIPVALMVHNYRAERSIIVMSATESDLKNNYTKLVNYTFVYPRPIDVKLWERKHNSTIAKNTQRYAEQGIVSENHGDPYLITKVMDAKVFLLYDNSRSIPYTVWKKDGTKCTGSYKEGVYSVRIDGKLYEFEWVPRMNGNTSYDDRKIRLFYSEDGLHAVEVIYDQQSGKSVRRAAKFRDDFLYNAQRFIIFTQMEGLDLNAKKLLKEAYE